MAAFATTPASLSLLPSFTTDRSRCLLSAATSSSSSCFFAGGTHFWTPKSFISISTSSSSLEFNKRIYATRFRTVVSASADYYSTLGVPKSANNKEIKAAYRRLARQVPNTITIFSSLTLVCFQLYIRVFDFEIDFGYLIVLSNNFHLIRFTYY